MDLKIKIREEVSQHFNIASLLLSIKLYNDIPFLKSSTIQMDENYNRCELSILGSVRLGAKNLFGKSNSFTIYCYFLQIFRKLVNFR